MKDGYYKAFKVKEGSSKLYDNEGRVYSKGKVFVLLEKTKLTSCTYGLELIQPKYNPLTEKIVYYQVKIPSFATTSYEGYKIYSNALQLVAPINGVYNGYNFKNGLLHSVNDEPIVIGEDKYWFKDGLLHRENDQPAVIEKNGSQKWYQHGKLHRENDQPAKIVIAKYDDKLRTNKYWYKEGNLHRDNDKPAVEFGSYTAWYKEGKHHRDNDNPAVIDTYYKKWYQDGKLHRDNDKPAICGEDQSWYKHGKLHRENGPACIRTDAFWNYSKYSLIKTWYKEGQKHRDDGPAIVLSNGDQIWFQYDKIHRDDGPAVITDNEQEWYQHGKLHRDDGPAVIRKNGDQVWYQHGEKYREDGPASITTNYYWNGAKFVYGLITTWYNNDQIHRDGGPAVITENEQEWYQYGKLHRNDGPARITKEKQEWYQNGELHRNDGPAVIRQDGLEEWWRDNKQIHTSFTDGVNYYHTLYGSKEIKAGRTPNIVTNLFYGSPQQEVAKMIGYLALTSCINAPLNNIKQQVQLTPSSSIFKVASSLVKQEGVAGFYRRWVRHIPIVPLQYGVFHGTQHYFPEAKPIATGALTGMLTGLSTGIASRAAPKKLLGRSIVGAVVGGAFLSQYDMLHNHFDKFSAGAIAGATTSMLFAPFDWAQTHSIHNIKPEIVRDLVSLKLWRGSMINCLRVAPAAGLAMYLFDLPKFMMIQKG